MQKFKTLNDVIALAEFAHRNQTDKAGMPYIEHPRRILANVQTQGALPYVQMAAILHDVTEDTAFTPKMLLDLGVPEAAVEIVKLLDRDYSEAEHRELLRLVNLVDKGSALVESNLPDKAREHVEMTVDEFYYAQIKTNPGAVIVKLADIGDNLQPWRLSYLPEATQTRLREKYAKAIKALT